MRTNRELGYYTMWVEYKGRKSSLKKRCSKPQGKELKEVFTVRVIKA